MARLQAVLKTDDLYTTVRTIGSRCELAACFRVLHLVIPVLLAQVRSDAAAEVIRALAAGIGADRANKLAQALTLELDLARLRRARDVVTEDDLRLFLALLLTQQQRRFLLPIVADYTSASDPCARIAAWIRELGTRGVLKVPADDEAECLVGIWLRQGMDAALTAARAAANPSDAERKIHQINAESLLTPLLREAGVAMAT